MSQPPFVSLNGIAATSVDLFVPYSGVPHAELHFDSSVAIPTGSCTLAVGALQVTGVIDTTRSGDYALATAMVFLGGAGGWRKKVKPQSFHNDASTGVKRSAVLSTTAAEVGETVRIAAELDSSVGNDFERETCPAARVLEQLYPATQWYVDTAGVTQIGPRPTRDVTGRVELLQADVIRRTVLLAADDPTDLLPGCFFTDSRLPSGFTVHDVSITVAGSKARATCYAGKGAREGVIGLIRSLVREASPKDTFFGLYSYRVVRMSVDRAELQVVSKSLGLPDILPVSLSAGLSGTWAKLAPGLRVGVMFTDGDPAQPNITHYSTKADPSFLPVQVTIDASDDVSIGLSAHTVHVGGREPIDTALPTADGRPLCIGDTIIGPTTLGVPFLIQAAPTNTDLSRIRTK